MDVRTTTWTGIGTDVSGCSNVSDVLKKAQLDYTVSTEPILTQSGLLIPNHVATVADIAGTPTVLGHVSDKYQICLNADAFDFVDSISDKLTFEKAGQTASGMVYIIGKLPSIDVLGDEVQPYVILQNGHNGRYSLKTTICPLRIVCQNQFNFAFGQSNNTISILHSSQMMPKIENARILLSSVAKYMEQFRDNAEAMAAIKLSKNPNDIIDQFFDMALKGNESVKTIEKLEADKAQLIRIYNHEDNQNFKGTAWGMVNAYSDYITHKQNKNTANAVENKFLTVTFEPRLMQKFVDYVMNTSVAA